MKIQSYLAIVLLYLFFSDISYAITEQATFESFYKDSSSIGWIIAGIAAVIGAAIIFFTGGTASPIVISIGSWIGGTMGLSGIAATNAGLALLGGGSIASGGFGIIGGAAVLTAALSFGTDIVLDYTLGAAVAEYEYRGLAEQSKKMPTLPLPLNDSGSNSYEEAIEILEDINKEVLISGNENQHIIEKSIKLVVSDDESLDESETAKKESLLSLLYFVSNDYHKAKKHAEKSIDYARTLNIKRTLPAFIFATSSLYDKKFDFKRTTKDYFKYAILAEPENPLIPLLFSIYLDRMMLRFNDGYLTEKSLNDIFLIMKAKTLEDVRLQNYTVIISRFFIRLKLEQQKISSLVNVSNSVIKDSPETLKVVNESLIKYAHLLDGSHLIIKSLLSLEGDLDSEDIDKITEFNSLFESYFNDKNRLASLVNNYKNYHATLDDESSSLSIYFIVFLMFILGIYFVTKKRT